MAWIGRVCARAMGIRFAEWLMDHRETAADDAAPPDRIHV
jgi:hypothetical protein